MITQTLKAKQYLEYVIIQMKQLDINLVISREIRKQAFKDLIRNIKHLKREYAWVFKNKTQVY